jgi:hypothetical protein
MTVVRIYALLWAFVLAAAGILAYTRSFNEVTRDLVGFVSGTLLAAGFIAVLPVWVDHHFAPKTYSPARLARISKRLKAARTRIAKNLHGGFRYVS